MKRNIKFLSSNKGFSLIELIVVLIITAILAQLGFTAFNRYARRTRAFAAKTALKNIQRECENNRDLEASETFTLLPIKGYSIVTRDTNSCYGQSSDGKVAVIADNQNEIPNYFYDFLIGQISCSFKNTSNKLFKDCSEQNNIAKGNKKWNDKLCTNSPEKSVPLYMSKGDQNFIKAYGVLQKWLSEPENISKTDKLPNSQSSSNRYHSFSINNNNLVTHGFLDENQELKKELEKSISSKTQTSEYKFDIWINPREKPSGSDSPWMREMEKNIDYSKKRPRLSVRRLGPEGYWRTAGHEIAKCN